MSQTIVRTDDVTGENGPEHNVEEHFLALDGKRVLIDLSATSLDGLAGVLAPYLDAGTDYVEPVKADGPKPKRKYTKRKQADGSDAPVSEQAQKDMEADAIRQFCNATGVKVSVRGRISNAARKAWEDAGKPLPAQPESDAA